MTAYRRPASVAVVQTTEDGEPTLYLASLPDGPVARLDGAAAVIWVEAIASDDLSLPERVARLLRDAPDDLGPHVDAFVADLVDRGLLERTD